ncbi:hypothetical protein F4779DRAFT_625868 [Xylariaceae sp. FL0662B]|nr:hypothetical protein F4779DRAFT_625868 [Xylariaceae sp. FL0662B]
MPDPSGKFYIVTGANSGVGKETIRILYSKNAKVDIAARSEAKAAVAIADIRRTRPGPARRAPSSSCRLTSPCTRLHALFNNAGAQPGPRRERAGAGHFLLTRLLTPVLVATPPESAAARVVRVSSMGRHRDDRREVARPAIAPPRYTTRITYWRHPSPLERYLPSVALVSFFVSCLVLLCRLTIRVPEKVNSGSTGPAVGTYPVREDLLEATKPKAEGGNGNASRFWEWCEEQVKEFLL